MSRPPHPIDAAARRLAKERELWPGAVLRFERSRRERERRLLVRALLVRGRELPQSTADVRCLVENLATHRRTTIRLDRLLAGRWERDS